MGICTKHPNANCSVNHHDAKFAGSNAQGSIPQIKLMRKLVLAKFPNLPKDGTHCLTELRQKDLSLYNRFKEQAKKILSSGKGPSSRSIRRFSSEIKQRLQSIRPAPIAAAPGTKVPRKRATTRNPQNIFKTRNEFDSQIVDSDFRCAGCGNTFGGYWATGQERYEMLMPEQGHITKTVNEGGLKDNVYPVCFNCQRIQGENKGMPLADFQAMVTLANQMPGSPRFVAKVIESV
jgi:hypothetical protein